MRSNHPELTQNCPIRLLANASQWFIEVRCGLTTPNSLELLLPQAAKWFEEVRCGQTTLNSFETAL